MNAFLSFLNGFLYTATLFLICLIFVVGVKAILIFMRADLKDKPAPPQKKATPKPTKHTAKPVKPVRSIEINPEEIDRIYVKKSS